MDCTFGTYSGERECTPTHPELQHRALLELFPSGRRNCRFIARNACVDNKNASYAWACDDDLDPPSGTEVASIICPVSCTKYCPTPDSPRPCSRAVWDTTYCEWNRRRCLIASGGDCTTPGWDGSCPPGTAYDYGSGMCCSDSGGGMCNGFAPADGEQSANLMRSESCCSGDDRLACYSGGGYWDETTCSCYSPIIIDTTGNGFDLTNAVNGVLFDLMNDGIKERLSWTAANTDDAFLVLDRNQNGVIDNGRELFGSSTLQPVLQEGETKHGFRALAIYDKSDRGGNNDNQIDSNDAVFSKLKL